MPLPQFDASGALLRPTSFEHWIFVGSNIGMSYSDDHTQGPGEFHNVYTQPEAFDTYRSTANSPRKPRSFLWSTSPLRKPASTRAAILKGK